MNHHQDSPQIAHELIRKYTRKEGPGSEKRRNRYTYSPQGSSPGNIHSRPRDNRKSVQTNKIKIDEEHIININHEEQLKQRKRVVAELIKTESIYVESLKMLKKYKEGLRSFPIEKLPKGYNFDRDLFGEIEEIYRVHKQFYKTLAEQFSTWNLDGCIGKELEQFMYCVQLSVDYVGKYDDRIKIFSEIEKSVPALKDKIKELDATFKTNLSITDYLITPVQRGPRYKLLLEQLLKATPNTHPDYPHVIKSLASILFGSKSYY